MELGAGGAAGPGQRGGAEPGRLLFLLLGGGGGGGSGWAWPSGGGGEGGTGTDTESDPEPDYEALPRGSAASTHMLAGAVAGVLEHSLMYPVDCVKVRRVESTRHGSCASGVGGRGRRAGYRGSNSRIEARSGTKSSSKRNVFCSCAVLPSRIIVGGAAQSEFSKEAMRFDRRARQMPGLSVEWVERINSGRQGATGSCFFAD